MTILRFAAWLSCLLILIVTIGPIGLRPVISDSADLERFAAFLVVGSLFGAAYPDKIVMIVVLLVAFVAVLEFGQNLIVGRHGMLDDFAVKAAGGVLGVAAGKLTVQALQIT